MSHAARLENLAEALRVLNLTGLVEAAQAGAAELRKSGDTSPTPAAIVWKRLPSSAVVAWTRDGRRVLSVMKDGEAFRVRIEDARTTRVDHESSHGEESTAMAVAVEVVGGLE